MKEQIKKLIAEGKEDKDIIKILSEEVSIKDIYKEQLEEENGDERKAAEAALSLFTMGAFDAVEGEKREKMIDDLVNKMKKVKAGGEPGMYIKDAEQIVDMIFDVLYDDYRDMSDQLHVAVLKRLISESKRKLKKEGGG